MPLREPSLQKKKKLHNKQGCGKTGTLHVADGNAKWWGRGGKVWQVLKKLKIEPPFTPATPLPGVCARELPGHQTDT